MKGEPQKPSTGEDNPSDKCPGPAPTDSGGPRQHKQGLLTRISTRLTRGRDPIHAVYLLLGIAAIFYMGYLQWQAAAIQQKDFKRKHSPDIAIELHRITNPDTKVPECDELTVCNYGSPIRDFHWDAYTFVRGCVPEDEITRREIHFKGYWHEQVRTGKRKEDVVSFKGDTNYKELSELTDLLRSSVNKHSIRPLAAVTYIALWYRDRDNNPYANYFSCESGGECVTIECADWQRACFAAKSAEESGLSLTRGHITASEVIERLRMVDQGNIIPSSACADCEKIKALLNER